MRSRGREPYGYTCCGPDYLIDADGVKTYYDYDALKQQIGTRTVVDIANGIERIVESTNILDGFGQILASMRVGTDGSVITQAQYAYDVLGRASRQTNALGGVTSVTNILDTAGGQSITTNTYPDLGTRIEFWSRDGRLLKVIGTAVHPMRYIYDTEQDGVPGPWREYI